MANMPPHQTFSGQLAPPQFDLSIRKVRFDVPGQQKFVDICGFFAPQAWGEKRFSEFRTAVATSFLARWPIAYGPGLPAQVAMVHSKINHQMKACVFTMKKVSHLIHWQNMLALRGADFENLGEVIRRQVETLRASALKVTPTLRGHPSDARGPLNQQPEADGQGEGKVNPVDAQGPMRAVGGAKHYPQRTSRSTGLIPFVRDIRDLGMTPGPSSIDLGSESGVEIKEEDDETSLPGLDDSGLEYLPEEDDTRDPDYTNDEDSDEDQD